MSTAERPDYHDVITQTVHALEQVLTYEVGALAHGMRNFLHRQQRLGHFDPYDELRFWYLQADDQDPVLLRRIDDLVAIAHAVAKLKLVLRPALEERAPDLRLARTRRPTV